jgi:signal transduction histidine kinase
MMRRIVLPTVIMLSLLWGITPYVISQFTVTPLADLRANTPLSLVWALVCIVLISICLMLLGWAWEGFADKKERGRWRNRFIIALALMVVVLFVVPFLHTSDGQIRPPLIHMSIYADLAVAWLAVALIGSIMLCLFIGRRLRQQHIEGQQAKHLAYLSGQQTDEGIVLVSHDLQIAWINEAGKRHFYSGKQLHPEVTRLLRRSVDSARVATQTIAVDESLRVNIQSMPMSGGFYGLISHPQSINADSTQFYERFIRRIVHDMRNPLAAIIAHASNLHTAPEGEHANMQRTAQIIETEAQRLTRLVDSILFDARLSHVPMVTEKLDLRDIVEEVYYQHDERALREYKTLELDLPAEPSPFDGDHDLLVRALSNLVDNSLKYSSTGTTVTMALELAPEQYGIKVIDNGEGIPAEFLPDRIFEALVRVRPRDGIAGSGLGLSIVKKIAQLHGGTVNVESTLNKGTTITLCLPRARS